MKKEMIPPLMRKGWFLSLFNLSLKGIKVGRMNAESMKEKGG